MSSNNCSICFEWHMPIKILRCGHSFCYRCLMGCRRLTTVHFVTVLSCPNCRSDTTISDGGIRALPNNIALEKALLHLGAVEKEVDSFEEEEQEPVDVSHILRTAVEWPRSDHSLRLTGRDQISLRLTEGPFEPLMPPGHTFEDRRIHAIDDPASDATLPLGSDGWESPSTSRYAIQVSLRVSLSEMENDSDEMLDPSLSSAAAVQASLSELENLSENEVESAIEGQENQSNPRSSPPPPLPVMFSDLEDEL